MKTKKVFTGITFLAIATMTSFNIHVASANEFIEEPGGQGKPCHSTVSCESGNGLNYGTLTIDKPWYDGGDEIVCCGVANLTNGKKKKF